MLRTRLAIIGSVSALTLLAATASFALEPPTMNLGTLKPAGEWKVGTVDAKGASYCAMVNRFDKQVVLAFARSPDGNGSLAMDFRENFFTPGMEYEVTLRADAGRTRKLSARASSDRSVVVQIGQDKPLYRELAGNGTLEVGLPTIDAAFSMRKFASSYDALVDCAEGVAKKSAAAPVIEVEKDALAAQVEDITDGKKTAADNTAKSADTIAAMEEQLDRDAAAEATDPARKLIASADSADDIPAPIAETAAQKAEKAEAADRTVAEFSRKDESLKAKIASTEKKRDALAEKVAASDDKSARAQIIVLQRQLAELKQERSAETAALTRKLAEAESGFATRLSAVETERDGLKQRLAAVPGIEAAASSRVAEVVKEKQEAEARLAAAERASRANLDAALAKLMETESAKKDLENRLAAAEQAGESQKNGVAAKLAEAESAKKDAEARITALDRQNKLLQVALTEQSSRAKDKGASLDAKLAALDKTHAEATAALQKKLDAADARYAALQKDYDGLKTASAESTQKLGVAQRLIAQLQEKLHVFESKPVASNTVPDEVARLKAALKQADDARAAEAARTADAQAQAAAAQAQLADARQQIAALNSRAVPATPVSAQASPLGASERAELEEYRRRAASTVALAAPAVPAAPVTAAVVTPQAPRKRLASSSPHFEDVTALAAAEPAAGASAVSSVTLKADAARARPSKKEDITWNPAPGYGSVKAAPEAAKNNFAVPSVPVAAVEAAPAPAPVSAPLVAAQAPSADTLAVVEPAAAPPASNRAAAFLDKIMSYHRSGAPVPQAAPPVKETAPPATPASRRAPQEVNNNEEPIRPTLMGETGAAPVPATSSRASPLENIEAGAGTATQAAPKKAPVAGVSLDKVLSDAVGPVTFVPAPEQPGATVKQWTAGRLTGLLEQQPGAQPFDAAVKEYLSRYQDDCGGKLKVEAGAVRKTPAGQLQSVAASCDAPGNAYNASFVFLQDGASFSAVLHTGVPADAADVKKAGAGVVRALKASGSLSAPAAPLRRISIEAPAVQPPDTIIQ